MLAELLIMFGLQGISRGIKSFDTVSSDNKYGIYIDGNGDYRINPTCRKVYYGHTKYGDRVIKDRKTGKILINIDLDKAKQYEQEAINKGYSFYFRSNGGNGLYKLGNSDIDGPRYCKVNEDKNIYYVRREINYIDPVTNEFCTGFFYMDMNYNLVSPTEKLIESYGDNELLYKTIMNECNHSDRKYNMKNDIVMYLGKASGFKYSHMSMRGKR